MGIRTASVLVAVLVGLIAGSARAQERAMFRVPFPFTVRGQEMPAGQYDVNYDSGILLIRARDNTAEVFATTFRADGSDPAGEQPALVFTHYENGYVLSKVWESGSDGLAVVERRAREQHAEARPLASDGATVVIAANWK